MGTGSRCCLCGIRIDRSVKRRFIDLASNRDFIRARCKASPFLYRHLLCPEQVLADSSVGSGSGVCVRICIPCVNWKRRVETIGLKRSREPMLQLDQLVYYLLQPGRYLEPDQRCMDRLLEAARDKTNPYRAIFPAPVQAVLDLTKANTYQACVMAWWEYNGRTEFFASGQEAKRVRNVMKGQQGL